LIWIYAFVFLSNYTEPSQKLLLNNLQHLSYSSVRSRLEPNPSYKVPEFIR
jgi:hypothetical protein